MSVVPETAEERLRKIRFALEAYQASGVWFYGLDKDVAWLLAEVARLKRLLYEMRDSLADTVDLVGVVCADRDRYRDRP